MSIMSNMNAETARELLGYMKQPTGQVRLAALAGRIDDLDAFHAEIDNVAEICKDTGNATLWEGVNDLRKWIDRAVVRKETAAGVSFYLPWFGA